jgi:hypothetical protein
LYEGDALVSSAYPVEKETSHFKFGTGKLVSHTQTNSKHVGDKITYGPFTGQKPYSEVVWLFEFFNLDFLEENLHSL